MIIKKKLLTFEKKLFIYVVMKYLLCIFLGFILSIVMIVTVFYFYGKGYDDGYYTCISREVRADFEEVLLENYKGIK